MKSFFTVCTIVGVVVVGNFIYRVAKVSTETYLEHRKTSP